VKRGSRSRTLRPRFEGIYDLRTDPFECAAITSNTYYDFMPRHEFLFVPARKLVGEFLQTFKEFRPARRLPASSLDRVFEMLQKGVRSN